MNSSEIVWNRAILITDIHEKSNLFQTNEVIAVMKKNKPYVGLQTVASHDHDYFKTIR